jgi:MFS family permease
MSWLRMPVRVGLAISVTAMCASTFGTLGLGALAPYLQAHFHLSTFTIGALPALVFLGAALVSVRAGHLSDRIGAGRTLALAQLGVSAAIGLAALAPSPLTFLAAVGIAGIGYGAVNPATNVLSTSAVPRRHRALFLGIKQAGVTIGGLLAGLILPSVADAVGWRASLLVPIGVLLLSSMIGVWTARREADGWFDPPAPAVTARPERRDPVAVPGGSATGLFGFISSGIQLSVAGYLSVFLVEVNGFSKPLAGVGLSVAFAAGCVGRPVWGAISDRFFASPASTLVITSGISVVGLAAMSTGLVGATLWVVLALVGFCSIGWNGVYMALITDRAADQSLGRATGRGLLFLYGGVIALPPLLGLVRDVVHSWSVTWLVATGLVLVAAVTMALAPRTIVHVRSGEPMLPESERAAASVAASL